MNEQNEIQRGISTKPNHYSLQRTSGCQGAENPHGWGWCVEYENNGQVVTIFLPDNIVAAWLPALEGMTAK